MTLTYQDHSPRERSGLGTMKQTNPKTQESLSKSVSGPVTVCGTEPVTSSVPTEAKNSKQDSKIDELTKLVQMLMDEKINSKLARPKPLQKPKLKFQIFYDHVNPITRRTINQSAGGKLRDLNAEESWALLEDLALYDNES
ncbi:hypothetical protein Tco_1114134 [Tanacetum coccineum]|uniref:Uncharacterized protein n=1 Tax=Tanacetum coccineum TaxID=301880 RepID=A0ABQ5IUN6_9ASTR